MLEYFYVQFVNVAGYAFDYDVRFWIFECEYDSRKSLSGAYASEYPVLRVAGYSFLYRRRNLEQERVHGVGLLCICGTKQPLPFAQCGSLFMLCLAAVIMSRLMSSALLHRNRSVSLSSSSFVRASNLMLKWCSHRPGILFVPFCLCLVCGSICELQSHHQNYTTLCTQSQVLFYPAFTSDNLYYVSFFVAVSGCVCRVSVSIVLRVVCLLCVLFFGLCGFVGLCGVFCVCLAFSFGRFCACGKAGGCAVLFVGKMAPGRFTGVFGRVWIKCG